MKKLRNIEWENKQSREDLDNENKIWRTTDVLPENIQDFESEMVVIGCDVEALYPSLDAKEVGKIVEEEIMRLMFILKNMGHFGAALSASGVCL